MLISLNELTEIINNVLKENMLNELLIINKDLDVEGTFYSNKPLYIQKGKFFGYYDSEEEKIFVGYDYKKLRKKVNNTLIYEYNKFLKEKQGYFKNFTDRINKFLLILDSLKNKFQIKEKQKCVLFKEIDLENINKIIEKKSIEYLLKN